ncbi:MAG: hypothetical protein K8J08_18315 [Thermoanaerobaculia bacterium]|nr:hypothetical protein [Thermoanaerobaculia bacterium]
MRIDLQWLMGAIVAAALVPAYGCNDSPTAPVTDSEVTLSIGQTVRIAAGELTFEQVPEDSRCPVDVDCIWAGDALVVLRLRSDLSATPVELHTGIEPRATRLGDTLVELIGVVPQPVSDSTIPQGAYRATLRLTAISQEQEEVPAE